MFLFRNPKVYPAVILLGNFLVPVVFVAFLYDHQHIHHVPFELIFKCFCLGGLLGVLGAGIIEGAVMDLLRLRLSNGILLGFAMLVGLIEEGCKLLAVTLVAARLRPKTLMDGLLLGAAAGMGFAALESCGYAFSALFTFDGRNGAVTLANLLTFRHAGLSLFETILRGFLAPLGHGTWTALAAGALFHESRDGRYRLTGLAIPGYLGASLLHGLWDGLPSVINLPFSLFAGVLIDIPIGLVGLVALILLFRRGLRFPASTV
jgi:RsiW-degrading membrane proteinase PrsW (M82 family)